jgi:molybdopterin-guanine dinucleotide biosynthesis protein A
MGKGLIILAGGRSRRMGTDKALLPVQGRPVIERILHGLKGWGEPLVVTNRPEAYRHLGVPLVADRYPGKGPLAGIHAGLSRSRHRINLVAACDMPFVSRAVADVLLARLDGYDASVPRMEGRTHPLFAVYTKECLEPLEASLEAGELSAVRFLSRIRTQFVDREAIAAAADPDLALFNMNDPADYRRAERVEAGGNGENFSKDD